MKKTFLVFWIGLCYMEAVYHLTCFGLTGCNLLILLPVTLFWAAFGTLLTGFFKRKVNKILLWVAQSLCTVIFAAQVVYLKIFRQPLLLAAIRNAGGRALKNFWREALEGILAAAPILLLLAVPLAVTGILIKKKQLILEKHSLKERLLSGGILLAGACAFGIVLGVGSAKQTDYFEEYAEFYDPGASMEHFGVMASIQRDAFKRTDSDSDFLVETWKENEASSQDPKETDQAENDTETDGLTPEDVSANQAAEEARRKTGAQVLPIDFEKLSRLTEDEEVRKLAEYMQTVTPTQRNQYTGMFEGYNLIYLTAEGFSPYAVDETLTPTLYRLIHSGFVAPDYYVPLWQTSTSDGEYVNLTGLIPDQQFSMKRTAENLEPFSLAAYFGREGVPCYAYHNNTLSYYDRHLSHPNLGYDFKASKLGELSEEEWGSKIFPMENAQAWPSSDLDMMKATIPEYIGLDRFHVYYMTVSGHMNYNFVGNQMSKKNQAAVENLPYSEEGRAYIACNIELDKALEYLIQELDKAGKLDKTVICLSADHYPYAMDMKNLEELAGKPLEGTLDIYRNNLILWNSQMETVEITKACSALDLMPTLLNLFGFPYDSRLFAGHDMLSDSPAMVVFSDRSFITDKISYYRKDRQVTQLTDEVTDEEYLDAMRTEVKNMNKFSAGVLNLDFYRYVYECLPQPTVSSSDSMADWY